MNGELVKTITSDGLSLNGFFDNPAIAKLAVLHIHGTAGNFYNNSFIMPICQKLHDKGYAFLSANTRGNGQITMMTQKNPDGTSERRKLGATYEIFGDCLKDVDAWVNFLINSGIEQIVLQGHSVGCHKATLYVSRTQNDKLAGLILISPSDIIGWQIDYIGERYQDDLRLAENLVKEGKGSELMPSEAYVVPISAESFLSWLSPTASARIFNYFDDAEKFETLGNVKLPIIATFVTKGEVLAKAKSPEECVNILKLNAKSSPNCLVHLIEGATHNYAGYEDTLSSLIVKWVSTLSRM